MNTLFWYFAKKSTGDDTYPENEYIMSGNRISVETLNLDADFSEIRRQLDRIVARHFTSLYIMRENS